jgi:hypothetical protein
VAGGGGDGGASKEAEKSYQLQLKMFEWQKQQALKLEKDKQSGEAKKAAELERMLQVNRTGRRALIKTAEPRPAFADFEAKYKLDNPITFDLSAVDAAKKADELAAEKAVTTPKSPGTPKTIQQALVSSLLMRRGAPPAEEKPTQSRSSFFPLPASLLKVAQTAKAQDETKKVDKYAELEAKIRAEQLAAYNKKLREEYEKLPAFKRLIKGPAPVVKKSLYATG